MQPQAELGVRALPMEFGSNTVFLSKSVLTADCVQRDRWIVYKVSQSAVQTLYGRQGVGSNGNNALFLFFYKTLQNVRSKSCNFSIYI